MKKALSLLVAFIFCQTESWALVGGPPIAVNGLGDVTGTYTGVLVGNNTDVTADAVGQNAIGIFALGVPTENLAQGTLVIFLNGAFFNGGMEGVADPDQGTLTALCTAGHALAKQTTGAGATGSVAEVFDSVADGAIQANFEPEGFSGLRLQGTGNFTVKNLNFLTFNFDLVGSTTFTVTGFRQSLTVVTPATNTTAALLTQ